MRAGGTGALTDLIACEDAYTNERALASRVLSLVQPDDLWLAVDPATPDGLTLPPDVVRALPGLVGAGHNGTA